MRLQPNPFWCHQVHVRRCSVVLLARAGLLANARRLLLRFGQGLHSFNQMPPSGALELP
ncbi:hypothetical protein BS78_01G240900 [Paspalum vaginatum]|nr:hypothetical protein BS78_01G240900 [Paspalum vaginatum]